MVFKLSNCDDKSRRPDPQIIVSENSAASEIRDAFGGIIIVLEAVTNGKYLSEFLRQQLAFSLIFFLTIAFDVE